MAAGLQQRVTHQLSGAVGLRTQRLFPAQD